MLVKDIMTKQVIAIGPEMPIGDVHALMEQRNIRHFPIVESDKLLGIVSDRDIRTVGSQHPQAKPHVTLKDPVAKIMVSPVITAHPLDPIEESAKVLRERKIGAMPVVEDDKLVGIVTGIDFLEALVKMTGVEPGSTRLEVEVENRPGMLAKLAAEIAARGVNIASVLSTRKDDETLVFVLRVGTIDGRRLANALKAAGFHVLWPPDKD
jgi:acetoin utilization protein AcuB